MKFTLRKLAALWLSLALLAGMMPATAETTLTEETAEEAESLAADEEDARAMDLVTEDEDDGEWEPVGPTFQEPDRSEYNENSTALYTAHINSGMAIFTERNNKSEKLLKIGSSGGRVEVLYVGTEWCIVRSGKHIGYARRQYLSSVTPVDSKTTPPYGVMKAAYIATTAVTCPVYKSMSRQDESWVTLNPGTLVSIWRTQDGWGIVGYWRTYGYINMNDLKDLIPVSPTDEPIAEDSPIAAFTSYYTMAQTKTNAGRIVNIRVACERLTRVMKPGASLNFNDDVGPYKPYIGYQPAPVLTDGGSSINYGGGTCQVSSTLYNALLQLPKIKIIQRRPHGPSGAKYLPHGVDAAVGNSTLNLVFSNGYDFSIRVEGHTSNDGALTMVIYKVQK